MSSDRYTHGHESSTLASHAARTAANSAAYLIPHLRPGMDVLDVGCGPGSVTLDLAQIVGPGQVVGIENTDAPLASARAAAAERGDRTTTFQHGDAYALPFADASFDVVHAHQVLQHLTDPVAALREMVRVARPGGWIAARDADYAAMSWFPELPALEAWRSTYRRIAHANGAEPDAGRRLRSWGRAADVPNVRITASIWCYADTETCTWWGNSQADRVAGERFAAQAAELGVDQDEVAAMVRGWRRWSGEPDASFFLPHGELLGRVPDPLLSVT